VSRSCLLHAGVLVNDKRYEEAVQKLQSFESVAGKSEALGAVDLKLLIAKVYSQWDRHFSNALEVYDGIINDYPNDYRYLQLHAPVLADVHWFKSGVGILG